MSNDDSSPTLINCTFTKNNAGSGGGIYNYNDSDPSIVNCILWGDGSDEIVNESQCVPTFRYCDVEGWTWQFGTDLGGLIEADPNFMDPYNLTGPDGVFFTRDDGLRIMAWSPCVDSADGTVAGFDANDITGRGRVNVPYMADRGAGEPNGYADIGAYESPTVWFVDDDASGNDDGNSWENAFEYLQDAFGVAEDGNEIWVAMGTYKPDCNSSNPDGTKDREATFELKSGVGVYGGFVGRMDAPQVRGWKGYNKTVLSGDINDTDNEDSYHVVVGADDAVLDGFVIRGGNADGDIYDGCGGGIHCNEVSPVIRNCLIVDNNSTHSSGIWNGYCYTTISNCLFSGNTGGVAVRNSGGGATLSNCVLVGNEVQGIYNLDSSCPVITNCTIYGNGDGSRQAGGMASTHSGTKPMVSNCIFWGNTGDEIYTHGGNPTFSCCDIEGSGGSEDWDPNLGTDGGGNKDANPLFADVNDVNGADDIFGTWDDGFRLDVNTSPCVDAGDGDAASASDILGRGHVDMNGISNTGTGEPNYVDIGAYEFTDGPAVGEVRIVVMCWIDESFDPSESKYYWGGERFSNHLFEYSQLLDLADGVVVKSGCLVPLPAGAGEFDTIEGVHPNEYEYDGNAPLAGISIEECSRYPYATDVDEFIADFERIREGYWPNYVVLIVDRSGSMQPESVLVIQPAYSSGTPNFVGWIRSNYPSPGTVLKRRDGPGQFVNELWVDEMRIQVEDVLDDL